MIRRGLPLLVAVIFGLSTLVGLLLVPELSDLLLGWATLLAGVALLLGILNLLLVHSARFIRGNIYSGVLIIAMFGVFILAVTDQLVLTEEGVTTAFTLIQAPLEAAVASLLAFFLLFAGYRLLQRQPNGWSLLFIVTVLLIMLGSVPLPVALGSLFVEVADLISIVLVNAGMRGILIGVALGTITFSLRLLVGSEQPYNK